MLRVTAGHDIEYPLEGAGTAVGYYLQDGKEPPGVWAGKAAEEMGLTGLVDPETYRDLFGKLIAPTGERLYCGRPPRYAVGKEEEAAAAVAALDEFATPAEQRRTRAKVLGSTGAAVPFYDLTFSATKSPSLLQASFAATAAAARKRGDTETADEFEAKVKAIDDAATETAAQVVALAEERALFVRTGHHSSHTGEFRDGAGAVAALFPQHDNRNGEPNLHVHTVLFNRAVRADQDTSGDRKWRSLYGKAIWDEQLGLGAAAERIFACKLAPLGIPLTKQEDGNAFEVGGVGQATMDAFSTRTRGQIDPAFAAEEAAYKREHGKEPSARQRWEWRQHLARSTRKAKQKDAPAGGLGLIWPEDDGEWPRDDDSAEIALEWQVQHVAGNGLTHKQRLKADGSTDILPLPPIGVAALLLAKRTQDKARTPAWPKKCVCGRAHRLVLTTRTGLPLSPRNVNRWFDARCKRYGVRRITVHDTRRTCGSLLAALDVHPRVAMAILRHSRIAMTMEIYTQVPDKATRDALRRLSAELDEQPAAQDAAADDGQVDDSSAG